MGSKGSKFIKIFNSASNINTDGSQPKTPNNNTKLASPLILKRQGSMFFDEDGHLAHEFYEEIPPKNKTAKATMKKIETNLIPQGDVQYKCPRLHNDYPVILHQV